MRLELAKSLVHNIDLGEPERAWGKFNAEDTVAVPAISLSESPVAGTGRRRRSPASSLSAIVARQLSLFLDGCAVTGP
jgi:hypothetical protein